MMTATKRCELRRCRNWKERERLRRLDGNNKTRATDRSWNTSPRSLSPPRPRVRRSRCGLAARATMHCPALRRWETCHLSQIFVSKLVISDRFVVVSHLERSNVPSPSPSISISLSLALSHPRVVPPIQRYVCSPTIGCPNGKGCAWLSVHHPQLTCVLFRNITVLREEGDRHFKHFYVHGGKGVHRRQMALSCAMLSNCLFHHSRGTSVCHPSMCLALIFFSMSYRTVLVRLASALDVLRSSSPVTHPTFHTHDGV